MFYYLDGVVTVLEPNLAVIDCGGVGYACFTTLATISRLEIGKKAKLFTYCNIKEDAFDIYGFAQTSEKRCFELLLTVSGVGPKAALGILSSIMPDALAIAVIGDDVAALTRAPGVGKKLAQRVILELKDKVSRDQTLVSEGFAPPSGATLGGKSGDAAAALAVLGYTAGEISAIMRKLDIENMTTEEIIKAALKQ
ncbi:MAG: Holliday junction branch migration protein RuvA [Oscillospiraceae bacterium]|jgi:Holliday junction DNA helicase RuvA|nr:Holliday junction branch migration protein RuvA [Oscillospiraceae bacterium]